MGQRTVSRAVASPFSNWLALRSILLALAMAIAAAAACGTPERGEPDEPPAPIAVPAPWQLARDTAGHQDHVGKLKMPCEQCHELTSGFDKPADGICTGCHQKQSGIRHATAAPPDSPGHGCLGCHDFGAAARTNDEAPGPWDCQRCHAAKDHPGQLGAHRTAPCQGCHTPHGERPVELKACEGCHQNLELGHGKGAAGLSASPHIVAQTGSSPAGASPAAPAENGACLGCHRDLHAAKTEAGTSCVPCHEKLDKQLVGHALSPRGHEQCTGCHAPHRFDSPATCESCHQGQITLAATKVPAHAACTNCHQPHESSRSAAAACTSCHQQLTTDHPGTQGASACTTCHPAHPDRHRGHPSRWNADVGSNCATCHGQVTGGHPAHAAGLKCTECHQPHQFKLGAGTELCARCHATEFGRAAALPEHARCASCHRGLPHFQVSGLVSCAECHGAQATNAHTSGQPCSACHEPHSGAQVQPCQACHAAEHASISPGHQPCARCHEGHTKIPGAAACAACHQPESTGLHHEVPGGCLTCHRAHGASTLPAAAGCTNCHAIGTLGALHTEPKHQECRQCHQPHQKHAGLEPAVCRSCHRDRGEHFPNAARCTGCHLFRSP